MSRYQELDNWLSKATAGLCDEAKARIATEIESHVREAIADLRERGIDEADAMRGAVATLGDVKKARRAFVRIYLSYGDVWQLTQLTTDPFLARWRLPLLSNMLALFVFLEGILAAVRAGQLWGPPGVLVAAAVAGLLLIAAMKTGRWLHRTVVRAAVGAALMYLSFVLFLLQFAFIAAAHASYLSLVVCILNALFFSFCAYRSLQLWRKLKRDPSLAAPYVRGDDETQSPSSV